MLIDNCFFCSSCCTPSFYFFVFFFTDTATTEIYTLSLHDALPIRGHALDLAHVRHQRPWRPRATTGGRRAPHPRRSDAALARRRPPGGGRRRRDARLHGAPR